MNAVGHQRPTLKEGKQVVRGLRTSAVSDCSSFSSTLAPFAQWCAGKYLTARLSGGKKALNL